MPPIAKLVKAAFGEVGLVLPFQVLLEVEPGLRPDGRGHVQIGQGPFHGFEEGGDALASFAGDLEKALDGRVASFQEGLVHVVALVLVNFIHDHEHRRVAAEGLGVFEPVLGSFIAAPV